MSCVSSACSSPSPTKDRLVSSVPPAKLIGLLRMCACVCVAGTTTSSANNNNDNNNVAFVSQFTNFPQSLTLSFAAEEQPTRANDTLWLLIAGSTSAMQTRLANARVTINYAAAAAPAAAAPAASLGVGGGGVGHGGHGGGVSSVAAAAAASVTPAPESFDLVPPLNYWALSPVGGVDYDYATNAFCMPAVPPPTVQLGNNCRAMVLPWRLAGRVDTVVVEALSLEVVVGVLAASVTRPAV
jgi:hypothetical protein